MTLGSTLIHWDSVPVQHLSRVFEQNILLLGDYLCSELKFVARIFVGHLQPSIQFLNAGVDGYNTEDALALRQGLTYNQHHPKCGCFWGNDIWENDWRNRHSDNLIPLDGKKCLGHPR